MVGVGALTERVMQGWWKRGDSLDSRGREGRRDILVWLRRISCRLMSNLGVQKLDDTVRQAAMKIGGV